MRFLKRTIDGTEYFFDDKFIFAKNNNEVFRLAVFDNGFHKLRLFNGVPVLEIDGLRMNLIKGFKTPLDYPKEVAKLVFPRPQDPKLKTQNRAPRFGSCLDTCMGLGYTALEAAKHAKSVVTCEISPAVHTLARWNPWSSGLFDNSGIEIMHGDISKKIRELNPNHFSSVIHDPPRFSKAGELYSIEFYKQLHRVMRKGGRLFHYVGSLGKGKGRKIELEVAKRLRDAGFHDVRQIKRLQGVLAVK